MSDKFKDFNPETGSFTQAPAQAPYRENDTYADFSSIKDAVRELISMVDNLQITLEKELTQVAMPVGDFDPRLVQAHKAEWPEEAGPLPSSVSYRFYKALQFRETTAASYLREAFEDAVRDVSGTPALDIYQLSDVIRDEALLVKDFLNKHIDTTYDQSEKRVLESLQDWVQAGKVEVKKLRDYYSSAAGVKHLSADQLERTSNIDAKQGQAVFKVKMNSLNADIARDMESLKRNFSDFAPAFYEKFLGPAMDFRLNVSRKTRPGSGDVNKEVRVSSAYMNENLKTVIADQSRRKTTFKTKADKLIQNIQTRDKYRSIIQELSEKGKPLPNAGPRVLVPTEESPNEVLFWASDYSNNYDPDKPKSSQTSGSGLLTASHNALADLTTGNPHSQYLLRSGGHLTGDVTLADGVRIDDIIPSKHAHTGEDGSQKIRGSDIIEGSMDDDVVDTTKKPATPFNLRITNYEQSVIPPGVTVIDATLTWDGDPELSHEVQIVRI